MLVKGWNSKLLGFSKDFYKVNLMTETQLISSAQQGSLDAFNQLVLMNQQVVFNLVFWVVDDEKKAVDISQAIFIQAYQRIHQFRSGSFRIWLLRLARISCLDELRREKRKLFNPVNFRRDHWRVPESKNQLADAKPASGRFENTELERTLHAWIRNLHVHDSHALVLVDMMDFNYAETAQIMDESISTVRSRVSRARLALHFQLTNFQHKSNNLNESEIIGSTD
jgi:RNA polymerase sigma-70 factor, ECF subfamily